MAHQDSRHLTQLYRISSAVAQAFFTSVFPRKSLLVKTDLIPRAAEYLDDSEEEKRSELGSVEMSDKISTRMEGLCQSFVH